MRLPIPSDRGCCRGAGRTFASAAWVAIAIVPAFFERNRTTRVRRNTVARYTLLRYKTRVAIRSFARKAVEDFFLTGRIPRREGWSSVANIVRRKLDVLDYAAALGDLSSPPGNRLEALRGDLQGSHSIRVNDQWRIVFRWTDEGPDEVDVRDYH